MPTKCSVSGCENYYSKGVPFFDVPSPLKYKFCSEKAELSKKRRKLWLDAMGVTNDPKVVLRICSKHFITGKPATLEKTRDKDWVPSLHMKSRSSVHKKHRKDHKDISEKGKDSNKVVYSSKKNVTPKHNRSTTKSSTRHGKTEDKIKKKDSRKSFKRVDLKKFLNCKVLLDGKVQCSTFKGTNGSGLTIVQKHGYFTSDDVTVKETALNNTILRIHLIREDLYDLKRKYESFNSPSRKKRKEQKVSSFGRQIKRKTNFFDESFVHTPSRKSVVDTKENIKLFSSIGKSERQMKNLNVTEDKHISVNNKLQARNELGRLTSNERTLNKTIRKQYRDKIKIKLFPKASAAIRRTIKNGEVISESDKSQLQRELLFVKKRKNEQKWSSELDKTYYLKFCPYRYPEDGTLDYSFQKLVTDVKYMKLPAPSWKIKVIIRQGKISAVTFTNKLAQERCVGFSANSDKFKITIDNRPALLLGSPEHVRTSEDLEILLDIVQNIDSNNPMIFYK